MSRALISIMKTYFPSFELPNIKIRSSIILYIPILYDFDRISKVVERIDFKKVI